MPLIAVTGPARSGKSAWAEQLAQETLLPVTYVATGLSDATDPEWQARIQAHQQRRPSHWSSLEISLDLAATLQAHPQPVCLLIDSLGTWVANGLDNPHWPEYQTAFLKALAVTPATVICVSEEVGWGVVPAYPLGRAFRDRLGCLQQALAPLADKLYLVLWGIPVEVKSLACLD